jgi:HlyD family secretion protein
MAAMNEAPQSGTPRSTVGGATTVATIATARRKLPFDPRVAIAAILFLTIIGLAIWYLARPEPLLIQGEAESTRIDIAARVSGRLAKIEVHRGQNVAAGAALLVIDNPELVAQLHEDEAQKAVADAELQRIRVGTRAEIIAERKAEIDRATADLTLAQQTYNRTKQLAADKFAPQSKLDEDADALVLAQRRRDQAKLAYEEAVRGFTAEEHAIAEANVTKAAAKVETTSALVDQLTITAPVASQVYQIPAEEGEVVIPGLPLISLVDLADTWLGFSLREDLIAGLKVGHRFTVKIPALGNRVVTAEVRVIAAKGEYAGWRATRATGDFDLRTFAIRAYPVDKVDGLRPGMSVYTDWRKRTQ